MIDLPPVSDEVRAALPPVVGAYITALEEAVALLTARVAALEARLGQNSSNSSRPPSSDLPGRGRPSPPPGGRLPGGQRGHRAFFRTLQPVGDVDAVVSVRPEACGSCGRTLPVDAGAADPADLRHQVLELPSVAVTVTE